MHTSDWLREDGLAKAEVSKGEVMEEVEGLMSFTESWVGAVSGLKDIYIGWRRQLCI